MDKVFASSATLGAVFSLGAFWLGCAIQKRFRLAILNPLLIAMAIVIATLVIFDIKQPRQSPISTPLSRTAPISPASISSPISSINTATLSS